MSAPAPVQLKHNVVNLQHQKTIPSTSNGVTTRTQPVHALAVRSDSPLENNIANQACRLHLFRRGEAQKVNTGFQHIFGKANQGDMARLGRLVLLLEDGGLVVELVDAARQLVNVGANQVRRGGMQAFSSAGPNLVIASIRSLA